MPILEFDIEPAPVEIGDPFGFYYQNLPGERNVSAPVVPRRLVGSRPQTVVANVLFLLR